MTIEESNKEIITKAITGKELDAQHDTITNPLDEVRILNEETKKMRDEMKQMREDIERSAANMMLAGRAFAGTAPKMKSDEELIQERAQERIKRFMGR